jgi:membrane-associated protease RseP (regulator of RpoE activity)
LSPAPFEFSPAPFDAAPLGQPAAEEWNPHPKFQDRTAVHVILLLLTLCSTTFAGALQYEAFRSGFSLVPTGLPWTQLLAGALWYSGTIIAILGCHELGHYFACRYYDVDASLPFFLPNPFLTGTFGAFIRIREPIASKRVLFDIGIAGPIAGFLVAVPALIVGIAMSNVVRLPDPLPPGTFNLGEPLLFRAVSWLIWGVTPEGYTVNLHPIAFAAWFGLLATAMNLFPIGQLDGGHISYAVMGRYSSHLTMAMVLVALSLAYLSTSWVVWAGLMVVMLFLFGRHHPRTDDEHVPLDRTRKWLALLALVMFALCFSPVPIEVLDVIP